MPEAVHNTQNDFWRPPAAAQHAQVIPGSAPPPWSRPVIAAKPSSWSVRASATYVGRFGGAQTSSNLTHRWTRYLEFSYIKEILGLRVASRRRSCLDWGVF